MVAVIPQLFDPSNILTALHPFYFAGGPPLILGVVYLAITRDFLFKNRVHDYNTPQQLHYKRPEPCGQYCDTCTPDELRFRTFDGHCNNLNQTGMGMMGGRYGRSALRDPTIPDPGMFEPDPYLIAEKLLKSKGPRIVGAPYNMWMTSWINFNLHDWIFHEDVPEDPYELRWGPKPTNTFWLQRTKFDEEGFTTNTETPWWDGSQIYGKTPERAEQLRVPGKCELLLDDNGNLPIGDNGLPDAGFVHNWWSGVEIIHDLFVKEHNYVCGMLRTKHRKSSEEELYQTARLVVAAVLARIHTVEWTPALLNNEVLNVSMHNNWVGLSKAFLQDELENLKNDKSIKDKLSIPVHQAVLKLVQKFLPGTGGVGTKTELYGTPYSLSEDFVSSYRMHPFIPDQFVIDGDTVKTSDMINEKSRQVIEKYGASKIVDAWGHQPPTTLTLHNYPEFLTHVPIPGTDGPRNMAVVDIVRDRERGMPRYNQARRQYGIGAAKSFEDITDNAEWALALKSVYKSVEDVDFLVGCLAESPRPAGYLISNTAFYVFIMNASRRILTDRFYQESYNAEHYTEEGLAHVEGTTFKSLILRHHPELAESVGDVTNAFFDWTGTPKYGGGGGAGLKSGSGDAATAKGEL